MFSNWTVGRKLFGVVAVGLLSFVLIGSLAYLNTAELVKTAGWVGHTHEVLEAAQNIRSLLKDVETGQRGYLATGESRFLEPYNNALVGLGPAIQTIRHLTGDNS